MVFYISISIIVLFVLWGIISSNSLLRTATALLNLTVDRFGWFYLLSALTILLFALYLVFSKYGNIRLGKDDDRPEYSYISWFAMLFSAGMGIGLVFYGVAEPVQHYMNPPMGIEAGTVAAANASLQYAFFHWGFHPWAIYGMVGLVLGYFMFRKGSNSLISSTFYPLLKDKVNGPIGKIIDILSIIATAFGVATSLGFGALQINGGLHEVFGIENKLAVQIIIIVIVTILYLISATTGLDKGIKILSNLNIGVAIGLMLFILITGPTSFIFDSFITTLGGYFQNIVGMSLNLAPFGDSSWIEDWTIFYWAWWIAWCPFVGIFIARISKGRTIKEFLLGVLLVPSAFSFLWFSVFGGTALNLEIFHGAGIVDAVQEDVTSALFTTLKQLPLGTIAAVLAITLITTFFITSADSATYVLGMLSSKGSLNPKTGIKLVWGLLQSSIAIILLISGGLEGLETMLVITALPFAIILLGVCFSFMKALKEEKAI